MAVAPVVGEPFDDRADSQHDDTDEQHCDELPGVSRVMVTTGAGLVGLTVDVLVSTQLDLFHPVRFLSFRNRHTAVDAVLHNLLVSFLIHRGALSCQRSFSLSWTSLIPTPVRP